MVAVVQNNLDKIVEACQQMQVASLFLIGSATREKDFTSGSDLDFVFHFKKGNNGLPLSEYDYFDLLFKLEEITGKKVDLIAEERISNSYFLKRINEEKICVYES